MSRCHDPTDPDLGRLGLDPADHAAVLRDAAHGCRARNSNEEGIPMILVLERVDDPESAADEAPMTGDPALGATLARAFEVTLDALAPGPEPSPKEIALALEVVAARWFTLGVPERP